MRDTGGEGGTGVTPAPLSQKRGLWGEGWGSHPCSWLVPCEALCFLSFPSKRLCFTCKQWQWPQLAWPSAASKLAGPRKEGGQSYRMGWGIRVKLGVGVVGHVQNASSFRPLMSCLCPPWESSGGTKTPLFLPPSTLSFSRMNESFRSYSPLCPIIDCDYPNFMLPSLGEEVPWVLVLRTAAMQQGPRGVVLATLFGFERKGWRAERKLTATHMAYKHIPSTNTIQRWGLTWKISERKDALHLYSTKVSFHRQRTNKVFKNFTGHFK